MAGRTEGRRAPIGFAHRGARAHAPENTLEAFALALAMGAGALESDVWITADGEIVLDHDGVAPDGRPIDEVARRELPPFVPTLAELYAHCGNDFELSLDVKDEAAAAETIRIAHERGNAERVWLCHWNWKTVATFRDHSDAVLLVDSTRRAVMKTPPAERAERMVALGIDALNLNHRDWTPAWMAAFAAAGRRCFAWDLQEGADLDRLLAMGADGVYSDWVDRMTDALARRSG